mgnify:CR=1 FL=1
MPLAMAVNPKIDKEKCTCKGKKLEGLVRIVNHDADFNVYITHSQSEGALEVRFNRSYNINSCGNWRTTEYRSECADFTIRFVESRDDADFLIYIAD